MLAKSITALFLALAACSFSDTQPGSLDPDFDATGAAITNITEESDRAHAMVVQADGKIVLAGQSGSAFANAPSDFALVRYQIDGSLDPSFGSNGIVQTNLGIVDGATTMALQPDGKILVGGTSTGITSTNTFALVRYNQDGTIDGSFNTVNSDGVFSGPIGFMRNIALQSDGKIVAVGSPDLGSNNFFLARYNSDGTLDSSFGENGTVLTDVGGQSSFAFDVVIQPNGKIVVGGQSSESSQSSNKFFTVVRYNSDGTLDNTFSVNGMVNTVFVATGAGIRKILIHPDGKITGVGTVITNSLQQTFGMVRYNEDGTLDLSFGTNGKVQTFLESNCSSAVLQPDGKIVVVGSREFTLARYLPDGSLDPSFGIDGSVTEDIGVGQNEATTCALQSDGKILAAGYAGFFLNDLDFAVARFISGLNLGVISFTREENALLIYPNPIRETTTWSMNSLQMISSALICMICQARWCNRLCSQKNEPKGHRGKRSPWILPFLPEYISLRLAMEWEAPV